MEIGIKWSFLMIFTVSLKMDKAYSALEIKEDALN